MYGWRFFQRTTVRFGNDRRHLLLTFSHSKFNVPYNLLAGQTEKLYFCTSANHICWANYSRAVISLFSLSFLRLNCFNVLNSSSPKPKLDVFAITSPSMWTIWLCLSLYMKPSNFSVVAVNLFPYYLCVVCTINAYNRKDRFSLFLFIWLM